jgi:hypothetical protein
MQTKIAKNDVMTERERQKRSGCTKVFVFLPTAHRHYYRRKEPRMLEKTTKKSDGRYSLGSSCRGRFSPSWWRQESVTCQPQKLQPFSECLLISFLSCTLDRSFRYWSSSKIRVAKFPDVDRSKGYYYLHLSLLFPNANRISVFAEWWVGCVCDSSGMDASTESKDTSCWVESVATGLPKSTGVTVIELPWKWFPVGRPRVKSVLVVGFVWVEPVACWC